MLSSHIQIWGTVVTFKYRAHLLHSNMGHTCPTFKYGAHLSHIHIWGTLVTFKYGHTCPTRAHRSKNQACAFISPSFISSPFKSPLFIPLRLNLLRSFRPTLKRFCVAVNIISVFIEDERVVAAKYVLVVSNLEYKLWYIISLSVLPVRTGSRRVRA